MSELPCEDLEDLSILPLQRVIDLGDTFKHIPVGTLGRFVPFAEPHTHQGRFYDEAGHNLGTVEKWTLGPLLERLDQLPLQRIRVLGDAFKLIPVGTRGRFVPFDELHPGEGFFYDEAGHNLGTVERWTLDPL